MKHDEISLNISRTSVHLVLQDHLKAKNAYATNGSRQNVSQVEVGARVSGTHLNKFNSGASEHV